MKNRLSFIYVLVGIISSSIGFFKSYVFLRELGYEDLGFLAVIQTISMLFGSFHFGYLNGSFRELSFRHDLRVDIFSSFYGLIFAIFFKYLLLLFSLFLYGYAKIFLLAAGGILGIFSLLSVFIRNYLLSQVEIRVINVATIFSSTLSVFYLLPFFMFSEITLTESVLSLVLQPLIFVLAVIVLHKDTRVFKLKFSLTFFKRISKSGIGAFLAGLVFLLFNQTERWSILNLLGEKELGIMSFVFLIIAVWGVVPDLINGLFFPKYVSAVSNEPNLVYKMLRNHFVINLSYSVLAIIFVFSLTGYLTFYFLPNYKEYVYLVEFASIGLLFKTLSIPFGSIIMAQARNKELIFSELTAFSIYVTLVFMGFLFFEVTLSFFLLSYLIHYLVLVSMYVYHCFMHGDCNYLRCFGK